MKQRLDRYIFGEVDSIRPFLLLRGLLLLLAFDCWLDLIPHGGRYGVGGFNVAHFSIMDAILPVPTPSIYVGLLVLIGLLSFVLALGRPTRPALAVLFGLYTYGWSMSMLDSYQHHYLISLLLFSCIFFPIPTNEELVPGAPDPAKGIGGLLLLLGTGEVTMGAANAPTLFSAVGLEGAWAWTARLAVLGVGALMVFLPDSTPEPTTTSKKSKKKLNQTKTQPKRALLDSGLRSAKVSAWGYVSFAATCALVYFYTAITKTAPDWREGHALRRLGNSQSFRELERQATGEGLPVFGVFGVEGFWEFMALGAIGVQLVTFVGFLVAARQDVLTKTWQKLAVLGLMLAPLSFHIGAELLSLEIGWFSFYMLFVVLVFFLPASLLRPMAHGLLLPAKLIKLPQLGKRGDGKEGDPRFEVGVLTVACAGATIGIVRMLDLPGDLAASIAAAVLLLVGVGLAMKNKDLVAARNLSLTTLVGAIALFASIASTETRYDYYRFIGGDHRRRGEFEMALVAYEKANRYVVKPYCVRRRRGPILECFRTEDEAEAMLDLHGRDGHEIRVARREAEEEMRQRVGR